MSEPASDRNDDDATKARRGNEMIPLNKEPNPVPPPNYNTLGLPSNQLNRNLPSLEQHKLSFPSDLQTRLRFYQPRSCNMYSPLQWDLIKDKDLPENTVAVITNLKGGATALFECERPCRCCKLSSLISGTTANRYPCFDFFVGMAELWPQIFHNVIDSNEVAHSRDSLQTTMDSRESHRRWSGNISSSVFQEGLCAALVLWAITYDGPMYFLL